MVVICAPTPASAAPNKVFRHIARFLSTPIPLNEGLRTANHRRSAPAPQPRSSKHSTPEFPIALTTSSLTVSPAAENAATNALAFTKLRFFLGIRRVSKHRFTAQP